MKTSAVGAVRSCAVEALEGRRLLAAAAYSVENLTFGNGGTAGGISADGHVGMSYQGNAAIWYKGKITDLGFVGQVNDVNDSGVAVGVAYTGGGNFDAVARAFVWDNGKLTYLTPGDESGGENGRPPEGTARAINNAGLIVGDVIYRYGDGDVETQSGFTAVVGQSPKTFTPPAGYEKVSLTGVNEKGQILGFAHNGTEGDYPRRAFLYSGGQTRLLPLLPGGDRSDSNNAIANNGNVALTGTNKAYGNLYADISYRAYTVGSNGFGPATDLGLPAGVNEVQAVGVNSSGDTLVRGDIYDGSYRTETFVYDGKYKNLESLINPMLDVRISEVHAINDNGQILVSGLDNGGAFYDVFLLTPTKAYSIRGTAFNDTDRDGTLDKGETGSGVRTVFIDANINGKFDSGERSTQSKADGTYVFTGLPAGDYEINRVLPDGYVLTRASVASANRRVTIFGNDLNGIDLGSNTRKTTPPPTNTAKITGTVFNDTNKNGKQDNGETNSGIRTVFIDLDGDNKLDANEKRVDSNGSGVFTFTGLAAGTYRVTRVFPAGFKLSNNTSGYLSINVANGQTASGVNLGSRTA